MTRARSSRPLIRDLVITNRRGLHARASARFVQCAEQYDAKVTVSRDAQTVGGTSIMGLMMLAATPGTMLRLTASGQQAAEVLDALARLIADNFGETD